ncbi:MAG TPA: hypothetical protein VMF89_04890, partial [Polyangiales bacterium]|nr:hypothetical protein [Polyangiales bacterium]
MTVRTVLSTLSICSALLAGCSEIRSPQAGDTNTSWLRMCERESDCGPGARCIAQLCTLPCEQASANICKQISKAATCDSERQACDVSCDADQDCSTLSADFRCESGRCRPLPELSLSDETLSLA